MFKKQPSYIVYFVDNFEDRLSDPEAIKQWESVKKAASNFTIEVDGVKKSLPIMVVEREKIAKSQLEIIQNKLNEFKKIGIDFHTVTMIMTIALRFIPTLIEEVDKIMNAQKSRGANFEQGSLMKRAKALIPLFIPLLFNSIRRAYELANAMTCRCYNGGQGKTTMNALKFSKRDYLGLLAVILVIVSIILLNIYCGEYNAEFTFNLAI